jgi:hypothetical protein
LLLRYHTTVDDLYEQVNQRFDFIWHVHEHSEDTNNPGEQASDPENKLVATSVLQVEASLHEEAGATDGTTSAATCLTPDAIWILWITKRAERANAAAANVWLSDEFEELVSLQGSLDTGASTAQKPEAEIDRRFAWRFEKTDLPLARQVCGELLLDRHVFTQNK